MKKYLFLTLTITSLFLFTCNSDNDNAEDSFNVKNLLTDVSNQQILPAINLFVSASTTLEQSIENYVNDTSEANLEIARQQWKTTAIAYEKTYVHHIGIARDQFIHTSIYNWPTVEGAIEFFISDNDTIDADFIATISAQAKSLAALEYLLFAEDTTTINSGFVASQKRRDYLRLSSAYLTSRAERLQEIWAASGDAYASLFVNNDDSGIQGSFNLYYNGMHNALDVTKTTKVGKPAGLENSQVILPELTQAYYSYTSKALVQASIESVESAYFNPNGIGVDDYVFAITNTTDLNDAIATKIAEVYTALDAITIPLSEAVEQEHNLVEDLHTKLEDLRILFAVDVRSTLSIVITTTDTDGD
ncbi:imelysin family protein [Oceanihabitans sp. 2_MG-2023]|uniref:imelysin family protein n=1 Tax=Oceanihabitans sp. 2_MG-2023 TaxID=3062661 RepID=UPI0026E44B14|nr:imelysin family protein [Oceanihabitans sp. 2_MG-2023]MDO6597110.1 imelysin family protein [Oceanihabitans sp. 2_MG-2023]